MFIIKALLQGLLALVCCFIFLILVSIFSFAILWYITWGFSLGGIPLFDKWMLIRIFILFWTVATICYMIEER